MQPRLCFVADVKDPNNNNDMRPDQAVRRDLHGVMPRLDFHMPFARASDDGGPVVREPLSQPDQRKHSCTKSETLPFFFCCMCACLLLPQWALWDVRKLCDGLVTGYSFYCLHRLLMRSCYRLAISLCSFSKFTLSDNICCGELHHWDCL